MPFAYYLKNLLGSFSGIVFLSGIISMLLKNIPESYLYFGIASALIIIFLGLTFIGYINAAIALSDNLKLKDTFYLHLILVVLLFSADLIFGSGNILFPLVRSLGLFVILQLGVLIYMKKQNKNFKEFLKLT